MRVGRLRLERTLHSMVTVFCYKQWDYTLTVLFCSAFGLRRLAVHPSCLISDEANARCCEAHYCCLAPPPSLGQQGHNSASAIEPTVDARKLESIILAAISFVCASAASESKDR